MLFFEKTIVLWQHTHTHNFKLFSVWFSHFSVFIPRPSGVRNKFQTFQTALILLLWTGILRLNEQNQSWSDFPLCFVLHSGMFCTFVIKQNIFLLEDCSHNAKWAKLVFRKPLFLLVLIYGILTNTAEPCSLLAPGTMHSVLYAPHVFHMLDISYRRAVAVVVAVAVAWDKRLRRTCSFTSGTFSIQGTKDCRDNVLIFTTVSE